MKARARDKFVVLQYLSDGAAVAIGLLVAYWARTTVPGFAPATDYLAQFWWAFALWIASLHLGSCYEAHPRVISFHRARRLVRASCLAVMLVVVRNHFAREIEVARLLYPMALLAVTWFLVAFRVLLQLVITRVFLTRGARSRVLIVGLGPVALRLAARCKTQRELGYELVGFVSLDESQAGRLIGGVPVLGSKDDLRRVIRDNAVDEVFVTETGIPSETFFQLFIDSERETARVMFIPSLAEMMRTTIHYDEVAGIPVYSMRDTPLQGMNAAAKRAMDIAGAGLGMLLLSPLFVVLAAMVKRSSPGPVLYKQTRLGLDGQEFKIYKFRTMRTDAEAAGPGWGGQEDPRATRIGTWMRRTNLDELPQLWNVFRGDMSLVGPRPERPWFADGFREIFPRYMSRHAVKTGMTGWAQVHGLRGDTSIQQRLRYDLYYIENWSLWLDIKILIMTFMPRRRRFRPAPVSAAALVSGETPAPSATPARTAP